MSVDTTNLGSVHGSHRVSDKGVDSRDTSNDEAKQLGGMSFKKHEGARPAGIDQSKSKLVNDVVKRKLATVPAKFENFLVCKTPNSYPTATQENERLRAKLTPPAAPMPLDITPDISSDAVERMISMPILLDQAELNAALEDLSANAAKTMPMATPLRHIDVPHPKDIKASSGMMSGQELLEKMGRPPKKDLAGPCVTLHKNSVAYKATLNNLQEYQSMVLNTHAISFDVISDEQITNLKTKLQDVIHGVDAYLLKHASNESRNERKAVMNELKDLARAEMSNLDQLGSIVNHVDKDIKLGDALALLRGGVTDASAVSTTLTDNIVDQNHSRERFGAGKVNAVSLLVYGDQPRVLKPLSKTTDHLAAGERHGGFDQNDMRIAGRNIASAGVAQLLGMENMIPMPEIVIHKGKAALAMQPAPGESLVYKEDVLVTDQQDIDRNEKDLKEGFLINLRNRAVHRTGNGDWMKSTPRFLAAPMATGDKPALTASLQKQLLDLQVLDVLCGQLDRQPENIFIQLNGDTAVVTGIDNDISFGSTMNDMKEPTPALSATYGGKPPLISREMYDKVTALDEDEFRTYMGDGITKEEKDAAVGRLTALKTHAAELAERNCIVDDFETWTHSVTNENVTDYVKGRHPDQERSYIARGIHTLEGVSSTPPKDEKHGGRPVVTAA